MHSRVTRALIPILTSLISICGCGSSPTVQTTPIVTATSEKPTPSLPAAQVFNAPGSDDAMGLHVVLEGFHKSDPVTQAEPSVGIDCGKWLVLASHPPTYTDTELQAMTAYAGDYLSGYGNRLPGQYEDTSQLPSPPTLALAAGAAVCSAEFQVTNTGGTSVVLTNIGMQLSTAAQHNDFPYRLLDICPLVYPNPTERLARCPPALGAGLFCEYKASIQIGQGGTGAKFEGPIVGFDPQLPGEQPCNLQLTLAPAQTITIATTIGLADTIDPLSIYRVTPYITIVGAGGQQDVLLPHLASTLVYVSTAALPCYQLQGHEFALLNSTNNVPWSPGVGCL